LYQTLDVERWQARPPSLINTLSEIPRTMIELQLLSISWSCLKQLPQGDGHPVLVLPGFLASDRSTRILRRYLDQMGYTSVPWGLGRNMGRLSQFEEGLVGHFHELSAEHDQKISIIGQSLGGVYGRELAKFYPDQVRQVISLGSPFGIKDSHAATNLVRNLFERSSGMTVEQMRSRMIELDPHIPPPVPCTAIYSKGDGVVRWESCVQNADHRNEKENIEVNGSHCGMSMNPSIFKIIADRLAQEEGQWEPFEPEGWSSLLYPEAVAAP